jgi:hypothetical protein
MDEVARFFSGSVPLNLLNTQSQSHHFASLNQPQLMITGQKSHSEEIISKNGIQKTVYIVVKNSPFHLQLGLANANTCKIDFNQIAFDAHLIYDCEGDKEVDFVKVKPMEFKSTPSENGQVLETELRIKVLTSQHEDMLFKVRIVGSNPITHEEIPGLSVMSSPIKVISKPEQLKKKQPNKKRTLTDLLVDTISRIEKKQEDQQKVIERLLHQQTEQVLAAVEKKQKVEPTVPAFGWEELSLNTPQNQKCMLFTTLPLITDSLAEKTVVEFDDAFSNLIKAYNTMKPEEKPEIIRKIIRNSSTRDTERLSELMDLFWTEGLQKELGGRHTRERPIVNTSVDSCNCTDCPHKIELERIDEFYKEFLSSGVAPVNNENVY